MANTGFIPNTVCFCRRPEGSDFIEQDGDSIKIDAGVFYAVLKDIVPKDLDLDTLRAIHATTIKEVLYRAGAQEQPEQYTTAASEEILDREIPRCC